jgi:hypothetical protein
MKRYRFKAAIQRSTGWGAFVFFPHDTLAELGTKARVSVRALFDGIPYIGSLMPSGTPYHRLAVPQAILKALHKAPGELLDVQLWKDDAPRTVEMPQDFTALLQQEGLLDTFSALTLTRRKEYRNWITSAKQAETRRGRLHRAIALLRAERGSTR